MYCVILSVARKQVKILICQSDNLVWARAMRSCSFQRIDVLMHCYDEEVEERKKKKSNFYQIQKAPLMMNFYAFWCRVDVLHVFLSLPTVPGGRPYLPGQPASLSCHLYARPKWCICATWGLTWKNSATYLSRNDVLLVIFSPLNNMLHPRTL